MGLLGMMAALLLGGCAGMSGERSDGDVSAQIDRAATAVAPWGVGEVVATGSLPSGGGPVEVYRRFVGVSVNGFFVVQDFYAHGDAKFSDPYELMQQRDVSAAGFDAWRGEAISGPYLGWYPDGGKKYQLFFVHGRQSGDAVMWGEDGAKAIEGMYEDGLAHGRWTVWHDNRQMRETGAYVHDHQQGLWQEWYDNGQLASEGAYQDGEPDGVWCYWYENGHKSMSGFFEKGQRRGVWQRWSESGELIEKMDYGGMVPAL
ncbi:MAG: hypothetical protein MESAZ_01082 [Saezia sanguinis]